MYLRQLLFLLLLSAVALSQATADSSPAGPTLPGTASNCSRWYKIKKGDTCDSVQKSLGITAKDFLAWNPDVSADCLKNFWVDQAYCVGVGPGSPSPGSTLAPSVSVSSGASVPLPSPTVAHSGSSSPTVISSRSSSRTVVSSGSSPLSTPATASPSGASTYTFNHPITSQTLISPSSTETAWPPTKTHPGQPATCNKWHQIQYGETCSKIKALYSLITMDDLMNWNPDLAADCDLLFAGWWVCVGVKPESSFSFYFPTGPVSLPETTPWTSTSLRRPSSFSATPTDSDDDLPSTVTAMPTSLVQANTTKDCRAWYQVNEWETCKDVVDLFGTFSLKDFTAWNPTVGDDCAMIQDNFFYCVAVPGTPANRTAPPPPEVFPTAVPRQPGVAPNCNRWWRVSRRQDCDLITSANGISLDDFHAWNPAIMTVPECKNLISDTEVCVGVPDSNATSTATRLPPYPTGMNHTNHTTTPLTSRFPPLLTSATWSRPSTWWTRPTGFTTSYGAPPSMPWSSASTMIPCSNSSSTSHQGWTSTGIDMTLPWTSASADPTKPTSNTPCDESTSTDISVTLPWTSAPAGTPIRHTLPSSSDQAWTSTSMDMTLPWTSASVDPTKLTSNTPCDEPASTDNSVSLPWTSLSAVSPWHTSAVTSHSPWSSTPCDHETSTSIDSTVLWSPTPTLVVPSVSSPVLTPTMAMTTPCVHTVTTTTTIICDTKLGP